MKFQVPARTTTIAVTAVSAAGNASADPLMLSGTSALRTEATSRIEKTVGDVTVYPNNVARLNPLKV